ncbi:MAG: GTP cyclohydrolase II [Psychromonas sp.]
MAELRAHTELPTKYGELTLNIFKTNTFEELMVITNFDGTGDINLRMHSACATSELFGSLKCDCSEQLNSTLDYIATHGGILVYLPQEGRGIGITNKIKAYKLQEEGLDTVEANEALGLDQDLRNYDDVVEILNFYGITTVQLITNNPLKISALEDQGIYITQRIPSIHESNPHSANYLKTKGAKMGHFDLDGE